MTKKEINMKLNIGKPNIKYDGKDVHLLIDDDIIACIYDEEHGFRLINVDELENIINEDL